MLAEFAFELFCAIHDFNEIVRLLTHVVIRALLGLLNAFTDFGAINSKPPSIHNPMKENTLFCVVRNLLLARLCLEELKVYLLNDRLSLQLILRLIKRWNPNH